MPTCHRVSRVCLVTAPEARKILQALGPAGVRCDVLAQSDPPLAETLLQCGYFREGNWHENTWQITDFVITDQPGDMSQRVMVMDRESQQKQVQGCWWLENILQQLEAITGEVLYPFDETERCDILEEVETSRGFKYTRITRRSDYAPEPVLVMLGDPPDRKTQLMLHLTIKEAETLLEHLLDRVDYTVELLQQIFGLSLAVAFIENGLVRLLPARRVLILNHHAFPRVVFQITDKPGKRVSSVTWSEAAARTSFQMRLERQISALKRSGEEVDLSYEIQCDAFLPEDAIVVSSPIQPALGLPVPTVRDRLLYLSTDEMKALLVHYETWSNEVSLPEALRVLGRVLVGVLKEERLLVPNGPLHWRLNLPMFAAMDLQVWFGTTKRVLCTKPTALIGKPLGQRLTGLLKSQEKKVQGMRTKYGTAPR